MWKLPLHNEKDDWVFFAGFLALIPTFSWTFHEYVSHLLNVPSGSAPGNDGPFYFLRQDVVRGICAATGMLLSLILVALTWKRFPKGSCNALWFAWLWTMPWAAVGLYAYCGSSHLMDPQTATAGWKTADEYVEDPIKPTAMLLMALVAVAMNLLFRRYRWGGRVERRLGRSSAGAAI